MPQNSTKTAVGAIQALLYLVYFRDFGYIDIRQGRLRQLNAVDAVGNFGTVSFVQIHRM